MRVTATALYANTSEMRLASLQSQTTHASDIADECCQFLAELICGLVQGQEYKAAKRFSMSRELSYPLHSILETEYAGTEPHGIKSSGYVIDTLQSALWAVENSSWKRLLKAVNLGDDADTVGAVAGQIAKRGYSSVPNKLKNGLAKERKVTSHLNF